jgi:hypothetical protein
MDRRSGPSGRSPPRPATNGDVNERAESPGRSALPSRPARVHHFGVVMYRDLLTQALDKGGDESRSDVLLADLVDSRARLHATAAAAPVAEALARELSYDGALIRLCSSLDVRATPAWFDSPERERARLERELAQRGIRFPGSQLLGA